MQMTNADMIRLANDIFLQDELSTSRDFYSRCAQNYRTTVLKVTLCSWHRANTVLVLPGCVRVKPGTSLVPWQTRQES